MKIGMNRIALLSLGLIFFSCSIIRQEKNTFQAESQYLLSKKFEMKLPIPFHTQKDNYEEGVVYFYSFVDSACIVIFQGAMVEFPMDTYQRQKTEIRNQREISVGVDNNNKFWRKDVWDGIRVYYYNVPIKNKEIYDKILEGIKISPL